MRVREYCVNKIAMGNYYVCRCYFPIESLEDFFMYVWVTIRTSKVCNQIMILKDDQQLLNVDQSKVRYLPVLAFLPQ